MPVSVSAPLAVDLSEVADASPHKFGIFSAFDPKTVNPERWSEGLALDHVCALPFADQPVLCVPGGQSIDWTAFAATLGDGTVYEPRLLVYGLNCVIPQMQHTKDKLAEAFPTVEQAGWEKALSDRVVADGAVAASAALQANVTIALAVLLRDFYGTITKTEAVVHASPDVATLLSDSLVRVGTHLETKTGERFVVGTGYPAATLFATGALFGYRGATQAFEVLNHTSNDHYAYVARNILIGSICNPMRVNLTTPLTT